MVADDLTPEQARAHRQVMIDVGRSLPGTTFAETAAQLARAEIEPDTIAAAMIIDTDIGGDADDALALAAAARHCPELALVLTADETGQPYGQRARFARLLLSQLGRGDIEVVAGATSGETEYFCVADLIPDETPAPAGGRDAVLNAVANLAQRTAGPIRWVGMAPLSNLALVCTALPEVAQRLQVFQMGGAINYRRPERAEHNIRLDVAAAREVLSAVADGRLKKPWFVISDTTFTEEIAVDAQHPLFQRLAAEATGWANLLVAQLQNWYRSYHRSTLQHDALTLSVALGLPFVRGATNRVQMDEIGRWRLSDSGVGLRLSQSADYPAFMTWLSQSLDPSIPARLGKT